MKKEHCEFCFGGKALVIGKTNDVELQSSIRTD